MAEETPQARLSARLIAEVRQIAAYADRCTFYGAGDALREHIFYARGCADELDALQRQLSQEKTDEDSSTRRHDPANQPHPSTASTTGVIAK